MSGFDRDKHLKPMFAVVIGMLILAGIWIYNSHQQTLNNLARKTTAANRELIELQGLLQEYRVLENKLKNMAPMNSATGAQNLIATVENASQQVGTRNQLLYVRPQPDKAREDLIEEGVEIRLEKLQLQQLVELLYQFESQKQALKVFQLRVRTRFDNPEQLDTVMTLSRFKEQR